MVDVFCCFGEDCCLFGSVSFGLLNEAVEFNELRSLGVFATYFVQSMGR